MQLLASTLLLCLFEHYTPRGLTGDNNIVAPHLKRNQTVRAT
jgi:hypothetical protein